MKFVGKCSIQTRCHYNAITADWKTVSEETSHGSDHRVMRQVVCCNGEQRASVGLARATH